MDTSLEEVPFVTFDSQYESDDDTQSTEGDQKKSLDIAPGIAETGQNSLKSEVYVMMEKMFKETNESMAKITKYVESNTDKFYSLSMSLAAERQFRYYNGKSVYISEYILYVKSLIQQIIHKFISKQIESIEEYKCTIKKIHVVPYIAKFSYFNDRFESIMMNFSDMSTARSSATTDYLKIIKSMFDSLEKLANTNEKHAAAFRMKNYSYFYHSLLKRPNLSQNELLAKQADTAKKRFEEACRYYILWMINFRFEQLFQFIDGLEDCIKTTSKEDIIYQTQFSKSKVKELIKKYDQTVLQKGITDLMKRMDKHIGQKNVDESSYKIPKSIEERGPKALHKEVWARMRKFFTTKYEKFESIITESYPTCRPTSSKEVEAIFDSLNIKD